MLLTMICAPFGAALIAPLLEVRLGRAYGWVCALVPAAVFVWLLTQLHGLDAGATDVVRFAWISALDLAISFRVDGLSLAFGLLITGIGALICLYAGDYLHGDARRGRFLGWLFLFMGAMLGVVFADDLFAIFVFWELTSVSSFVLIGFDHHRPEARKAALQALLVTGLGGLALLAGFILLGNAAGTYRVSEILTTEGLASHPHYAAIVWLLVLGAFTKSAQFPFHFWLPNAMEAPTPASAYLHSATMVKAGLYLMARMTPALGDTSLWYALLVGGGGLTMVVSAVLAVRQTQLKALLAYTTVTALGIIMFCIGLGTPLAIKAAMTFLFVHALYKACLFLVAGNITHATHEKDTEKLGGLWKAMPVTLAAATLAALSMAGIPPLFGFIGKEVVYEAALHAPVLAVFAVAVAVFGNIANVFVAIAVGAKPFWGETTKAGEHAHEAAPALWIAPLTLALLGLAAGLYPPLLGHGIIAAAAPAVLGEDMEVHLALWHGINAAFLLSLLTLALGTAAWWLRGKLRRANEATGCLGALGPASLYDAGIEGMLGLARLQTQVLQHGFLRNYLFVMLLVTGGLVGAALFSAGGLGELAAGQPILLHEALIALLIVGAALATVRVRTRLGALACLGAVGYGIAALYVSYSAPDLAMTQIVVESLVVLLFAFVVFVMPRVAPHSERKTRLRDFVLSAFVGSLMGALAYGAALTRNDTALADFFKSASVPEAHGRNIVNVILVDFRALDTLGEITVLAIASVGALALWRTWRYKASVHCAKDEV